MRRICQSGDAAQGSRRLLPDSSVGEKKMEKEQLELSKEKKVGRCFYPGADQRFGFKDGSSIISTHTATHQKPLSLKFNRKDYKYFNKPSTLDLII